MEYIRYPSYYKEFQCIASSCSDSCCVGWEIDIDEETWEKYQQVGGEFGKRLKDNIQVFQEEGRECACFSMDETERCPFLNEKNLCDIILNLGEEYLGQICTDHPRYYDWFVDGQECGIGLCCEEAARLILQERKFRLEQEEVAYPEEIIKIEEDFEQLPEVLQEEEAERELEQKLFGMREEVFAEISSEKSLFQKMDILYDTAYRLQDEYDAWFFSEDIGEEFGEQEELLGWNQIFWQQDFLVSLIDFYLDLEINKEEWRQLLQEVKMQIPAILSARAAFFEMYQKKLYEYEQLLDYFIYRHFMSARKDDEVAEKVIFALVSTSMLQVFGVFRWLEKDKKKLEEADQIAICKLYSQEIEYHEENMNKVAGCMKFLEE